MRDAIRSYLDGVPPGKVGTLLCGDVIEALAHAADPAFARGAAVAVIGWRPSTRIAEATRAVVEELARAALAVWPAWQAHDDAVNLAWDAAANRLCEAGRLPLPAGHSDTVHARHLARALDAHGAAIVFALTDPATPPPTALAFARTVVWTASETGARVLALVPEALGALPELDAILYGAATLAPVPQPAPNDGGETTGLLAPPLVGRPNPNSPGECLLAERLAKDRELAGLFAFNIWVGGDGERYLVDLVWTEGRLAVEVDGYRWHSTETMFRRDRHRDYRLMTWGYRVLRLPHDEVMADPALQIEKIRDLVRLARRGTMQ